jgi:hypothetical protein
MADQIGMFKRLFAVSTVGAALASSAHAAEPFLGRWAVTPAACYGQGDTAASAPLIATATWLTWFDGHCRIGKMYKAGETVYLQVHCSTKGDVPVTLNASSDRIRVIWGGAKFEEMKRCK